MSLKKNKVSKRLDEGIIGLRNKALYVILFYNLLDRISRVELRAILQEGLNHISENQEEKHKYAQDYFISVLC